QASDHICARNPNYRKFVDTTMELNDSEIHLNRFSICEIFEAQIDQVKGRRVSRILLPAFRRMHRPPEGQHRYSYRRGRPRHWEWWTKEGQRISQLYVH